jgi:membrane protease YdiL (CAAX protease family)
LIQHESAFLRTIFGRWIVEERNTDAFKVAFLSVVTATLLCRRETQALRDYFIGRWAPGREHGVVAARLLVAVPLCAALMTSYWPTPVVPLTTSNFASAVLWAPIHEEVIFRGLFLGILLQQPSIRPWFAVLLSALAFAALHDLHNFREFGNLVILGLLLGYAYVRFRSVPFCIACHAVWNLSVFCPAIHPFPEGQAVTRLEAIRWSALVPLAIAWAVLLLAGRVWPRAGPRSGE